MPRWGFMCNKCEDAQEVIGKIKEYDELTLKDKPCKVEGCNGMYEHSFEEANIGHVWRDGKPTPRFHR